MACLSAAAAPAAAVAAAVAAAAAVIAAVVVACRGPSAGWKGWGMIPGRGTEHVPVLGAGCRCVWAPGSSVLALVADTSVLTAPAVST